MHLQKLYQQRQLGGAKQRFKWLMALAIPPSDPFATALVSSGPPFKQRIT